MPSSINSSVSFLATAFLLLFVFRGFERCLADAALVPLASKSEWSSGRESPWPSTTTPPTTAAKTRTRSDDQDPPRTADITSIAKLRALVNPKASHLAGCVLFLNATSAAASGCSASRPRRLRVDPAPALPLVSWSPGDVGLERGGEESAEGEDGAFIAALRAGEDAALLDLLLYRGGGGDGNSTSGGGGGGHEEREKEEEKRKRLLSSIAGVVALPGPPPEGPWSPDDANPQAEYCPYDIPSNFSGWVPGARGLLRRHLPFPMVAPYGDFAGAVASAAGVAEELERDDRRRRSARRFSHLAALDDEMDAVASSRSLPGGSSSSNSSYCLEQGTCGPIGGHSVWASLPAMTTAPAAGDEPTPTPTPPAPPPAPQPPNSSASPPRTVVLAAASDARQLLHGGSAGAGSLSGLLALLAAAEALGNATRSFSSSSSSSSRERPPSVRSPPPPASPFGVGGRVLFVALAAEPWGFLGSRRLLWEARGRVGGPGEKGARRGRRNGGGDATRDRDDAAGGFPLGDVSWMIELGSVGDSPSPPLSSGPVRLFAHPGTTPGSREGPAAALVAAGRGGGSTTSLASADVSLPSAQLPGPPPGSLWAWSAAAPSISSALLSAHEASLGGNRSSSRWDDAARLDLRSVAEAASVAARAAAAAAGASSLFLELAPGSASSPVAPPFLSAEAMLPRVADLASCLVAREPGLGGGAGAGATGGGAAASEPCQLSLELLGRGGALEAAAASSDGGGTPHHAGPLATLTRDPQRPDPLSKKPYQRFLWEFLARATRSEEGPGDAACDPLAEEGGDRAGGRCPPGSVCARRVPSPPTTPPTSPPTSSPSPSSVCTRATVAYVASYPLNIECVGCDGAENYGNWKVYRGGAGEDDESEERKRLLPDAAEADAWRATLGWPLEPLWAESNWREGVPSLSVWRVSSPRSLDPSSGVFALWSLAAAATAGCWAAASAARSELRRTRWGYEAVGRGVGGDENDEDGGERGRRREQQEERDLFEPSF